MEKKNFIQSWEGPRVGSNRLRWKPVEGGSLTAKEEESLGKGFAVFHTKSASRTKIFVKDEDGIKYAVTIDDVFVNLIKIELSRVGYIIP